MSVVSILALAESVGGALLAGAILGCCLWTCHLATTRILPRRTRLARWAAVMVASYWSLSVVTMFLLFFEAFRLEIALPLWVGLAAVASLRGEWRRSGWETLCADVGSVWRYLTVETSWLERVAYGLGGVLASLRVLRGLVAPPLAWDALTYHLLRAGRWVQTGGSAAEKAPDQWGFYEYFLPLGEVPSAWAMLATRDDSLLAVAGGLLWMSCLVGAGFAARAFGASRRTAALAAVTVAFLPGVFEYITASYVEVASTALFLAGMGFACHALARRSAIDAWFCTAAFAVLAGIKWNYLPLAVAALGIATICRRRDTTTAAFPALGLVAAHLVGISVAFPGYLRAWIEQGHPLYPLTVKVMGWTLLSGNEELAEYSSGALFPGATFSLTHFLRTLFDPTFFHGFLHLGFGPTGPLLAIAGFLGAVRLGRRRDLRWAVLFASVAAMALLIGLLSENYFGIYAVSTPVLGRMWSPSMGVLIVFASTLPTLSTALLGLALVTQLALAYPFGWSTIDWQNVLLLIAVLVATGSAAGLMIRRTAERPLVGIGIALTALAIASAAVTTVRQPARYRYYSGVHRGETYDVHPLFRPASSAWPLWRRLDVPDQPLRLAVAAGWAFGAWNWYRYPLLGSRLQNEVVYVPVTSDGELIDYRLADRIRDRADFRAWLRRLVERKIDYVVLLPPLPLEVEWTRSYPEVFERVVTQPQGKARAYRLHGDRARQLLKES